jgi:hypothetical protein
VECATELDVKVTELFRLGSKGKIEDKATQLLNDFSKKQAEVIVGAWTQLLPHLITKFHDGYRAENLEGDTISMHKFFYPKWFLDASGFFNNKPNVGPEVIMFQPHEDSRIHRGFSGAHMILAVLTSAGLFAGIGYTLAKRPSSVGYTYTAI